MVHPTRVFPYGWLIRYIHVFRPVYTVMDVLAYTCVVHTLHLPSFKQKREKSVIIWHSCVYFIYESIRFPHDPSISCSSGVII